ncbi:uncharacterized protein N7469_009057 [Penicillium citrinum]|uniref:Apple domain-containing protein n=2 Tax=Penicillium TaxID=5073 RepID=A0A9W9NMP2_PENCI|nr:uncharacterized protein N7469_009057 [Penicillium citrinum]KAJ5222817.1 hypothetical protein N7469_009057 [Penicillium citrinum]KAJ5580978.1 hypothetical protein N7450_007279 [Penicillium hetheringtonii]
MLRSVICAFGVFTLTLATQPPFGVTLAAQDCGLIPGNSQASYDGICPPGGASDPVIQLDGGAQFKYKCDEWATIDNMKSDCASTIEDCAKKCASEPNCLLSSWYAEDKQCYLIDHKRIDGGYAEGNHSNYVLLEKVPGSSILDPPGPPILNTKNLCANDDGDGTEFFLRTPNNQQTKWRVYCNHRATPIEWNELGVMNATTTPYDTLLAHRHWDAGYRAFVWKDIDFSYRHATVYNLPDSFISTTLDRFFLQPKKGSREHVIARIDDTALKFTNPSR